MGRSHARVSLSGFRRMNHSGPAKDRAMFLMPRDKELQFPAVAVLQAYVNKFQAQNRDPMYNPTGLQSELAWDLRMNKADWQTFLDAGLALETQPEPIEDYDVLMDMSDRRLQEKDWPDKHAAQVCGFITGVAAGPTVQVRGVKPKVDSFVWRTVGYDARYDAVTTMQELLTLKDGEITGVVGVAGPETYMAVCMGLAVVEILPPGRGRNWLSKWTSAGYRMIETQVQSVWPEYIARATKSIEVEIQRHLARRKQVTA